jgi:hypothetical protein
VAAARTEGCDVSIAVSIRVAAGLLWFAAAGFGIPCVLAVRDLTMGRGIPYVMGFPAYGEGPFESIGLRTTVPLLLAFLLVSVLEGVAGWLLWIGRRAGGVLAVILLPFGALFWWGFALPFGPVFALVRTILILGRWRDLR